MTADVISIPRAALHEQVAMRLRQMLVEGRIAPGAKLNERELAEILQVSRTPLREAIKMLAAEGLVELLPNRGAVAVSLSEQDVLDSIASEHEATLEYVRRAVGETAAVSGAIVLDASGPDSPAKEIPPPPVDPPPARSSLPRSRAPTAPRSR